VVSFVLRTATISIFLIVHYGRSVCLSLRPSVPLSDTLTYCIEKNVYRASLSTTWYGYQSGIHTANAVANFRRRHGQLWLEVQREHEIVMKSWSLTNIWRLYIANDNRYTRSLYAMLIRSHIQCIEPYQQRWFWEIFNGHFKHLYSA